MITDNDPMGSSMATIIQTANDLTLATYQAKTREYIRNTPLGDENLYKWFDACLKLVPREGTIFEIGSGLGRDAEYIRNHGFAITCSDAVPNFVHIIRRKGFEVKTLNILKETIDNQYDLVFANAVLPHFSPNELELVLDKVHKALKEGGSFAFSLKKGSGGVWSNEKLGKPRYFYYWQPEPLKNLVTSCGFKWTDVSECHTNYNSVDWMLITILKE